MCASGLAKVDHAARVEGIQAANSRAEMPQGLSELRTTEPQGKGLIKVSQTLGNHGKIAPSWSAP